ncbi:ATPase [Thermococcus siculi]|uniref:ATPase n=1 Tax=Thermococcus siculi TaxID=72803 RepID=A0A2Z2MP32_9EURY|nr:DUF2375 family protein [Thermococcus siculi]ASJ09608.1 ATPase [Thermococcus siculi]
MRLVLKPLFDAELPAGFEEIVLSKLSGREVTTGDTVEIDLLEKPLKFKVLLAEPSPLKVGKGVRVEFSAGEVSEVTIEFEREVDRVLPFGKSIVVVLEDEVLILNHMGQKVYSRRFEKLKEVKVVENKVVVVHGDKITLIEP